MGTLYVVATPLGNLGDLAPRAREVLGKVSCVYAEDTRVTLKLLAAIGVQASCKSYREALPPVKRLAIERELVTRLQAGEDLAYCSDAGTPGISDPGDLLVAAVRAAGFPVVPVVGPSAMAAILSVAGIGVQRPWFAGFPPHAKGRETFLRRCSELLQSELVDGVVFFEAPTRVRKLLAAVATWGEVQVVLGRELTKVHEEVLAGSAEEVLQKLATEPRGECVVLVART